MLCALVAVVFLFRFVQPFKFIFYNPFVWLPNFLIHEFSHRIMWPFARIAGWFGEAPLAFMQWVVYLAGNGGEWLVPIAAIILCLRVRGGRMLLPFLFYWSATTWYDAALYVSDTRAQKMRLVSSDMVSSFKPGEMKGDWFYILEPFGLTEYDVVIGYVFYLVAAFLLVMAAYSLWYYLKTLQNVEQQDADPWEEDPNYRAAPKKPKFEDRNKEPFLYFDDEVLISTPEEVDEEQL